MMPLILRNRHDRSTVQLAHVSAMRSTNEIIDQLQMQVKQLQEQLRAAHEQNAFNCAHYEEQIRLLLRDLIESKYQLAKRTLADAPSPSQAVH
jgi:hypothetical protein